MMEQSHYIKQSMLSNPGRFAHYYDDLPKDLDALCDVLRGLIFHYDDQAVFKVDMPSKRYQEMDVRSVENKLDLILSLDSRSLCETRKHEHKVMGVCRDLSLLLCSVLRHRKIPARLRSGFANYYVSGMYLDSTCVEYWHEQDQQWRIVDVRTSDLQIQHYQLTIDFDLYHLPENKFLPAEKAWRLCRHGMMRANHFGSRKMRGLWYVRNRLMHELAFLNKKEMLIWDLWGYMLTCQQDKPALTAAQFPILDELSYLISQERNNVALMEQYYQSHPDLKISYPLGVFNPLLERRMEYV